MKHSSIYCGILSIATCLGMLSCVDEAADKGFDPLEGEHHISFNIACASTSRASEVTGSDLTEKEKNFEAIDIFFYPAEADTSQAAAMVVHAIPEGNKVSVRIPSERMESLFPSVSSGNTQKCKVFAVVNSIEATNLVQTALEEYRSTGSYGEKAPSIGRVMSLKATTESFATSADFVKFVLFSSKEQGDEVTYNPDTKQISGTINVKTLAAKIGLYANVVDQVTTADGTKYTPVMFKAVGGTSDVQPNATVYLVKGTKSVYMTSWGSSELKDDDYFDLRDKHGSEHYFGRVGEGSDVEGYQYSISPIYTYPNEWTDEKADTRRSYIIIMVEWKKEGEAEYMETYYSIPLNSSNGTSRNKLLSNVYYRLKIDINTLGGSSVTDAVTLENCSFEILDWGDCKTEGDVREPRFLEITQRVLNTNDKKIYNAIMNNETRVSVPYYSSHRIKIKELKIHWKDFNPVTSLNGQIDDYDPVMYNVLVYKSESYTHTGAENDNISVGNFVVGDISDLDNDPECSGLYIDAINHNLVFQHTLTSIQLENSKYKPIGEKRTYSPYWIEINLCHADQEAVEETVSIIQYPAIWVDCEKNPGDLGQPVNVGVGLTEGANGPRGGVYVNGGSSRAFDGGYATNADEINTYQAGGVSGIRKGAGLYTKAYSENPYMYILHVTQLSDDDILMGHKLHIGDPRCRNINTYLTDANEPNYQLQVSYNNSEVDLKDVEDRRLWESTGLSDASYQIPQFRKAPAGSGSSTMEKRLYDNLTGGGTIKYYYPTNEGQMDEEAYMVAPIVRMSSAYGTVRTRKNNLTRSNARIRAASYQEMGLPAGRWRLPTIGEMGLFNRLCAQGFIPEIFSVGDDDYPHWIAQGLYKTDSEGVHAKTSTAHRLVRCVYDDWYWVKEVNGEWILDDLWHNPEYAERYAYAVSVGGMWTPYGHVAELFVWGDKEKNNPEEQRLLNKALASPVKAVNIIK